MSEFLHDSRTFHVFMPARFDDLPLTMEAFRVYCHLARRADKTGRAFPSLAKIGEHCFRGSYPNSSAGSLKAKAIAAIKELCEYGLIRKELVDEGEGYKHNNYFLTDCPEWKSPEEVETESCNVRKGRPGLTRSKKSVNPSDRSVTEVNHPVNPDNREKSVNGNNSVNGVNQTRLTGLITPVNGGVPKGISNEGISNEGTLSLSSQNSKPEGKTKEKAQTISEPIANTFPVNPIPVQKGSSPSDAKGTGQFSPAGGANRENPVERFERMMRGDRQPWEDDENFVRWVSTQLPVDERMHPLLKARSFLRNCVSRGDLGKAWDYWKTYQELQAIAPPVVSGSQKEAIAAELRRLGMSGMLPYEWQERTGGAVTVSELSPQDASDYLAYLRNLAPLSA